MFSLKRHQLSISVINGSSVPWATSASLSGDSGDGQCRVVLVGKPLLSSEPVPIRQQGSASLSANDKAAAGLSLIRPAPPPRAGITPDK